MLVMPRAFKPLMMLLPIKPAAPVTTIFITSPDSSRHFASPLVLY